MNTPIENILKLNEYRDLLAANDGHLLLLFLAASALLFFRKLPKQSIYSIILLGALVRLPQMTSSFWYDETFTAGLAALSPGDLSTVVMSDVHPPLWYLISSFLPPTEVGLRLPSLLLGLVSIWLIYAIGLKTANRKVALMAALLVALLPGHVYYSTEARAYALLLTLVLLTVLGIVDDRPSLFMISGLLGYTHAHGYLYLAVAMAFALPRARTGRGWRLAVGVSGIANALYLPIIAMQSGDVANGFWLSDITAGSILWPIPLTWLGTELPDTFMLVAIVAVFMLAIYALSRYQNRVVVGFILGVPALAALVSVLWHPVYLPRALLPSTVLLALPVAETLTSLRTWRLVVAAILPVALLTSLPDGGRHNVRAWFDACAGKDYVYAIGTNTAMMASYYASAPVVVWDGANDLNQWLSDDAKAALDWYQVSTPPPGDGCLIDLHNPMVTTKSREHLQSIAQNAQIIDSDTYWMVVRYEVGS